MQQLGGWSKNEAQLNVRELLSQNFLYYDGKASVPEQILTYLSTNWKELRNLPKDDPTLVAKARDRWYVPDPRKAGDLEKLREKALLKEFEEYKEAKKKLKVFRLEAVRAGFKKAWQERDYTVIIAVAEKTSFRCHQGRSQATHVVRPSDNTDGREIMARADLLIRLVQSGIRGDKVSLRKVVEAIISEERTKQHKVLAEQLEELLTVMPFDRSVTNVGGPMMDQRMGNLFHEVLPQRKLSDLILPDEVQQICQALIQEQHRIDLLRSYNIEPRNRILLIGSPGNGKTSLAEAIAEALMIPLLVVRYESVVGTYLGETAVRLKKIFEYASNRKCVLFFDEFETLGKERGDLHETGEIKRVVSSLLMQIDNLPSHVIVVGATNHPELLDRAVWRRFQVRMTLPCPTRARLTEWFEKFERRIKISLGYTPGTLAKRLLGANFAEIEEFGATVFRQYVLDQPNADMKDIVSKTLQSWSARSVSVPQHDKSEVNDA